MWFEYLIFVLIGLTEIYCCNGITDRYRSTKDTKTTGGILRRHRRAAEPPIISNRHVHDFKDGSVLSLERHTFQGSPTDGIISSQQHTQPHYAHPNNQYYQQQPQTFQIIYVNNAQKPRGNQQAHISRQLQNNGQYKGNNNDNGFNEYYMNNRNRVLQEPSDQVGIMHKHNRNNGNYNHHNFYRAIEYNNGNTRNSAILNTNVETGAKLANAALFTRPAVRMEAIHQPQYINSNSNLLTEMLAHPVPTTIKAPTSTEYDRSQFRRNVADNPFLNKEKSENPFFTNRQTSAYTTQNTPPSKEHIMVHKPTVQNPYMLNPFLQNTKIPNLSEQPQSIKVPTTTKIPNLSEQSQSTKVSTTAPVQSQIATTTEPFVQIITSTPPNAIYPTSQATTINAELSRLIRNKAVIFPDSIYLTRTTPSVEHFLDIRR